MASYARKALHGAMTVFVLSLVSAFTAYLFRFLLARKLTVADYGLFFALFAFINLLFLFKDFGLGYALVKFIPGLVVRRKWDEIKSFISTTFVVQCIASLIVVLIVFLLRNTVNAALFRTENALPLFLFLGVFSLAFPQNILFVTFHGFQRLLIYATQDLVRNVLVLAFAIAFFAFGWGVYAPIIAYLAMYAFVFFIFFFLFTQYVFPQFWKARAHWHGAYFRQLLSFGFPAMLTIFGNHVLQYIDTLMLTYYTNLTTVGFYQVAVPLAALVLYFAHAASTTAMPMIAELQERRRYKEMRKGIELLHKYLFVVVIPAAMLLLAFPEIFIRLFFGEKFLGGTQALQILSTGAVFYTIAFVNLNILFGLGKPRHNTTVMLITALCNVALNFFFIPAYGILGAALATSASFLVMLGLSSYWIKKLVRVKLPVFVWGKIFIAALVLIGGLSIIKGMLALNPWLELILGILLGGAIYALLLFVLRIIENKELHWIAVQMRLRKQA